MASVIEKEPLHKPSMIILGIFGYHNTVTSATNQDNTLTPMLQELGRLPDMVLLPSEGNSSIYVGDWAESLHIKTQVFQSPASTVAQVFTSGSMSMRNPSISPGT